MSGRRGARDGRGLRAALATALTALSACSFTSPGTDDTSFACAPSGDACPVGYGCEGGTCVRGAAPDASVDRIDAGNDPRLGPDAAPAPDAAPGARTLLFGDNSLATVRGALVDTTIESDTADSAHGRDESFQADVSPVRYGLVRIDVSQIPAGSRVEQAQLVMTMFDPIEDGAIELQALLQDWDEGTATFNDARNGTRWRTAGAAGSALDATVVATLSERTQANNDVDVVIALPAALVQRWVDSPDDNFGLRLRSTSPTERGGQWRSREHSVATRRPYLRVTYR